jgi:hypothetical protein
MRADEVGEASCGERPTVILLKRHPVHDKQSRHSAELTNIIRDQDQPSTSGMPGYLVVKRSGTLTAGFQGCNDSPTMHGGIRIKIQNFQPCEKTLHNLQVGIRFF